MMKPKIITLCGSTRFKDEYEKAMKDLTLQGNIIISVGLFGYKEGLNMEGETKKMLDDLHLRKIDISNEIFVINVGGYIYIGESTNREIEYAIRHGKKVKFLEENKDQEINMLKAELARLQERFNGMRDLHEGEF